MNKKYLLFFSMIIILGGGLSFGLIQQKDNSYPVVLIADKMSPNISEQVFSDEAEAKKSTENHIDLSYVESLLFVSSEKSEMVLKASGKLRHDLQGEVYLDVNVKHLLSLNKGDELILDIPELKIFYKSEVSNTSFDQFGNKTIEAKLIDQDMIYSSIFTLNKKAIYANIATPDGLYVMEGNGLYAWIAETNDLIKDSVIDPIRDSKQVDVNN